MTRFGWLQTRTQTFVTVGALAALAVAAAITGVQLSHLYNTLVAHCRTGCGLALGQFLSHYRFMDRMFEIVARMAPALIGIFWGAPLLARELESGTYQLVWTQSVTRSRWLVTKLAMGALASVIASGLLTLTITWWYRAHDKVGTEMYAVFDRRDIAPIGYAVFAFAIGVLIGAIIRRTLPAMVTTLAVYVFALVAVTLWVRPHLLTPIHKILPISRSGEFVVASFSGSTARIVANASGPPNSWTLSSEILTNAGHKATSAQLTAFVHQHCASIATPPVGPPNSPGFVHSADAAAQACLHQAAQTFHLGVSYLPADRYWTLQWLETGIFAALALAAALGCYWWVPPYQLTARARWSLHAG